jgi:hypothetical protein
LAETGRGRVQTQADQDALTLLRTCRTAYYPGLSWIDFYNHLRGILAVARSLNIDAFNGWPFSEFVKTVISPDGKVKSDLAVRPERPTRDYCLPSRNHIRWIGQVGDVEPCLCDLLGCLLVHGEKTPIDDAEEAMHPGKENKTKTLRNDVSALNQHLVDVMFPWTYGVRGQFICQKQTTS